MSSISRFFAPKKQKQCGEKVRATKKTTVERRPHKGAGEWEKPVGLLPEWAIEISDDDSETKDGKQSGDMGPTCTNEEELTGTDDLEEKYRSSVKSDRKPCASSVNSSALSTESLSTASTPGSYADFDRKSRNTALGSNASVEEKVPHDEKTHALGEQDSAGSYADFDRNSRNTALVSNASVEEKVLHDEKTNDLGEQDSGEHSAGSRNTAQVETNPFAAFAFDLGAESSYFGTNGEVRDYRLGKKEKKNTTGVPKAAQLRKETECISCQGEQQSNQDKERVSQDKGANSPTKKARKGRKRKSSSSDYVPIRELGNEEKMKIRSKWQSLGDPNAELEVRRFQVLIAARLHAQAREPIVRAAMDKLRKHFSTENERLGLCAETMSQTDPEKIAPIISSVLFANVKARHIVQAAKEIRTRFGGEVPEASHSLKQITGIGPTIADILSFCNSRASYS